MLDRSRYFSTPKVFPSKVVSWPCRVSFYTEVRVLLRKFTILEFPKSMVAILGQLLFVKSVIGLFSILILRALKLTLLIFEILLLYT